eukprot:g3669.t1
MSDEFWQDRDVRFEVHPHELSLRRGERLLDSINSVEDTKGNNGERGSLTITNMRIIWKSHRNVTTNLSIGYNCVSNIKIRSASSKLRGKTQALYLMTKFNENSFEFIFTSLVKASPRLFVTLQAVHRSYESTKLYRDLKLRGAIIKDQELVMLPKEELFSKVPGVWNLSNDLGNLGTFFITNVRLAWHASLAANFNVSMPYIQMKSIKVRNSKFGMALVIETSKQSGAYVLGFRIDPKEKLQEVYQELHRLHEAYSLDPVFGIDCEAEEIAPVDEEAEILRAEAEAAMMRRNEDTVEILEDDGGQDTFAVYFADNAGGTGSKEPVFDHTLGLAVEKLPGDLTISKLWSVIPE